jgi:hypothetical protein
MLNTQRIAALVLKGIGLSNAFFLIVLGSLNWILVVGFIRLISRATVAITRRAQRRAAAAQIPERIGVASTQK